MVAPIVIPILLLIASLVGLGVEIAETVEGDKQRAHEASSIATAAAEAARKEKRRRERRQRRMRRARRRADREAAQAAQEPALPGVDFLLPIGAGAAVLAALAYSVGSRGG